MRKPTFCICENSGTDQLHSNENKSADKASKKLRKYTTALLSKSKIFICSCTAWVVSCLFGNHIVGLHDVAHIHFVKSSTLLTHSGVMINTNFPNPPTPKSGDQCS